MKGPRFQSYYHGIVSLSLIHMARRAEETVLNAVAEPIQPFILC